MQQFPLRGPRIIATGSCTTATGSCTTATECLYYCHRLCTTATGCLYYCHRLCTTATRCLYYCHRVCTTATWCVLLPPGVYYCHRLCSTATGSVLLPPVVYYCHLVTTQLHLTNISSIRRPGTGDLFTPSKVRTVDVKVSFFFHKEIIRSETYLFLFSARNWSFLICMYPVTKWT
jgi:hypothetical protein